MGKIHRLSVDIKLPSDTPQGGALDLAGKYVKDYFIPAIESSVTDFDVNQDVVIPQIVVDLGKLPLSDVPEKLETALREELIKSFSKVSDSLRTQEASSPFFGDSQFEQTQLSDAISSRKAVYELFLEYLSKGYTDFHSMEETLSQVEIANEVIGYVQENPLGKTRLIDVIRKHYPFSFYRLESFLSQDLLPDFIVALLSDKASAESLFGDKVLSNLSLQYVLETEIMGFSKSSGTLAGFLDDGLRGLLFDVQDKNLKSGHQSQVILSGSPNDPPNDYHDRGSSGILAGSLDDRLRGLLYDIPDKNFKSGHQSQVFFPGNPNDPQNDHHDRESSRMGSPQRAEYLYSLIKRAISLKPYDVNFQDEGLRNFLNENLRMKLADVFSSGDLTEARLKDLLREVEEESGSVDLEVRLDKRIHTDDAGLVILHPFYRMIFSRLGLTDEQDSFVSMDARLRAAHLLKCISDGIESSHNDNDMLFCKLLCGIPLEFPMESGFQISDTEREEIEALYASILEYWNPFKSDSSESLRMAFIKRSGTVEKDDSSFIVRVTGSAVDILMDDLPWEISMIYLPWTEPFFVEWQKEF